MILKFLIYFFVFVFGVCIGSFLNCAIYRLEQKKKITGRSYCPKCKKQLSWMDLIPVLSFFILKGKCRNCRKSISWQYPLVELATGLLFLLIFDQGVPVFYWVIACFLIIIFVYDLKHYIIPDKVLFPAIAVALAYDIFLLFATQRPLLSFFSFLIAVIAASGFFLAIFLVSGGKWMGFGDVKLAILLGLILGWPNILIGLFLSFFFGAIIGVAMMILRKKSIKSEIPFGPFLITGTLVALFWSQQIIQWYLSLFQIP